MGPLAYTQAESENNYAEATPSGPLIRVKGWEQFNVMVTAMC